MASERRAYFIMPDSIINDGLTDKTVADLARLSAFLNTRWARNKLTPEESCVAHIGPHQAMLITNTKSPKRALTRLSTLAERAFAARMQCVRDAAGVLIIWPKFMEFQGYKNLKRPNSGEISGRVGSPAPDPAPDPKRLTDTSPSAPSLTQPVPVQKRVGRAKSVNPQGYEEAFALLHACELQLGVKNIFGQGTARRIAPACVGISREALVRRGRNLALSTKDPQDAFKILNSKEFESFLESLDLAPWKGNGNGNGEPATYTEPAPKPMPPPRPMSESEHAQVSTMLKSLASKVKSI